MVFRILEYLEVTFPWRAFTCTWYATKLMREGLSSDDSLTLIRILRPQARSRMTQVDLLIISPSYPSIFLLQKMFASSRLHLTGSS